MHRISEEDRRLYEEVVGKLRELIAENVDKVKPKLIVLYGSFARGDWHMGSDLDLCVVSDNVPSDFRDRWDLLCGVVMGFSVEPHIYTTQEFEEMLTHGRMAVLDALTEGVMLYADSIFLKRVDRMLEETMRKLAPRRTSFGWELKREKYDVT